MQIGRGEQYVLSTILFDAYIFYGGRLMEEKKADVKWDKKSQEPLI